MKFDQTLRFVRKGGYLLPFVLLIGLSYFLWTEVTKTRGSQDVLFRPAKQSCDTLGEVRYCIYQAEAGTNGDVVYHLHGRNLDEHIWNDDTYYTAMLQAEWQLSGALPPTVVTMSYGPTWLLTPQGEKPDSGLLDDFMERLPGIEARIGTPRRRLLLGESMGGLNVLVAGLSYPSRFAKVAALCPGVYAVSPFASFSKIRDAAERTGANPKIAFGIWAMARKYLADEDEWRRFSPLHLITQSDAPLPALYLSNGLYDSYGNYKGTEQLAETAHERGIPIEWRPLYGGHCSTDIHSLANFLAT